MKKILLLLTLVLALLLMSGCGSPLSELIKPNNDVSDVVESTEIATPSINVESTEQVSEPINPNEFDAKNQYVLGNGIFTSPQIPESLIYHSSTCKIYAKNIEYDTERCRIAFTLENKGEEIIQVDHLYLSVNDWMITNIVNSADVIAFYPGTTTDFHVSFDLNELKIRHIDAINEFIVTFEVEGEMTQLIVLRTNENEQNTLYKPEGHLIYEDNDIKAIVPKDGCIYDGKLYLYVENNSNETIYFDCSASSTKNKDDSGLTECQTIILPFSKEIVPVSLWDYNIKLNDTIKIECYSVIYDLDNHIFSDSELKYGDQYTINITA